MKPIKFNIKRANVLGCANSFSDIGEAIRAKRLGLIDGLELRGDAPEFATSLLKTVEHIELVTKNAPMPILITVRDPQERGQSKLKPKEREQIFETLMPYASAVDIEVKNLKLMKRIVDMAQKAKIPLVASYHDFRGVPSLNYMHDQLVFAKDFGADIFKTAAWVNSIHEFQRLQSLFAMLEGEILQAMMGMGPEFGKISRLLFASLGSTFNYGYLSGNPVPGQWRAVEMRAKIAELQQAH